MGKCSFVIWNYFFPDWFFIWFLLFFCLFFFLSNVCMVAMLIILILFMPNLETVVQFLTVK